MLDVGWQEENPASPGTAVACVNDIKQADHVHKKLMSYDDGWYIKLKTGHRNLYGKLILEHRYA